MFKFDNKHKIYDKINMKPIVRRLSLGLKGLKV